ncbi:exonuclease domain-containing protein [Nonlabens ponticola]|uniref:Exonuclease n=1 Tax=Nonlabens ponticola TaxID=2496866 RepID=A0A3S9MYF5_9FLAO|nr:exonuclease domain-containing protein [Nonlabens ponticola]AZQ44281.1 exonuclease [Nonlabens ponticola]
MYAIIDVESTGGAYNEEGITEIAIYRFDGHDIVDQFASLINPEQPIQPFVVKLTGINNKMLVKAPKFYEVAKRILEITKDATLVAHNAEFDNRMLRLEFDRLGYKFDIPTLCTVEVAQKLLPEQESYSLGKLVKSLGIPITDRHRATGDALATVKLFKLLLDKDLDKQIIQQSLKTMPRITVDADHKALIEKVPSTTGVLYFYNDQKQIIYIGKARNMRKRVRQHFTSSQRKSITLRKLVDDITFEKTGNDLIANIKEYIELKKHQPSQNRKIKGNIFSHGIYTSVDGAGYIRFHVKSTRQDSKYLMTFSNVKAARTFLGKKVEEYELCATFSGINSANGPCIDQEDTSCLGACTGKETPAQYNERAQSLIEELRFDTVNQILIDRGRTATERSAILIENGEVKGYSFVDLQLQFTDPDILRNLLTPIDDAANVRHIVRSFLRHKAVRRVVEL